MGPQARVSVVTLGVADVPRARSFYQALGWPLSGEPQNGVAFFKNAGSRLALYSREAMAEEARRAAAAPGSIGVALALMSVGGILYFPIRSRYKPGVPDVDPFEAGAGDD